MPCESQSLIYSMDDTILHLTTEVEIPPEIIANLCNCYVRLHIGGDADFYPFGRQIAENTLTEYTAKVSTHADFRYFINTPVIFSNNHILKGTKYIKVGFKTNCDQQNENAEMIIKDFKIYKLL